MIIRLAVLYIGFNSRTPGGVRLAVSGGEAVTHLVSIHAPREGCDGLLSALYRGLSFNSRTPGGVRLIRLLLPLALTGCFNSRTPGGVRL